ncbi:MAG TPA: glycosyltransferase family 39 protein [Aggregatilineales bacterium]|nr:glycosyltransferase family 39 protein [Aggregatilineales bacterium]
MAKWRPLLLILALALGLRLIALSTRSLWYDEAFAVLFSQAGLSKMLYGTLTPVNGAAADVHPLLYYSLLNVWISIVGDSVAAVRLLSVITGLATVAVLYALARELFDDRTAVAAALIAAIMPFSVQYSQEVRMYALLGLLLLAATWCYVRGWRTGRAIYWIGFGVLAGLSMYTQQLAAFYLIPLGLIPLWRRDRQLLIRVVLSGGLALIIYAPWLVSLPSQIDKIGGSYWIPKPTPASILETFWVFLFVELEVRNGLLIGLSFVTLAIVAVFLGWFAIRTLRRPDRDREALAFVLWLVAAPIALMWLFSQWRPVYLNRGLLPCGLMFYIALGWLLTRTRLPNPIRVLIALPVAVTALAGLYEHYTWATFPRPPFAAAVDFLHVPSRPGDRIVHANKITMLPMVYYDRLNHSDPIPARYVDDVAGTGTDTLARPTQEVIHLLADPDLPTAAQGASRLWYVIFDRQLSQGNTPADMDWLEGHYQRVSVTSFNDLLIYLYTAR